MNSGKKNFNGVMGGMLSRMRLKSRKRAMAQLAKSYPQVSLEEHKKAVENWWAKRKSAKPIVPSKGRSPGRPIVRRDMSVQTLEAACSLDQILIELKIKAADAIRISQLVQLVGGESRVEPVVGAIRQLRGLLGNKK